MALKHAPANQPVHLAPLAERPERAQSHALVKTDTFETMQLVLPAGLEMPRHQVEGVATIHVLEGAIQLIFSDRQQPMTRNDWVHLSPGKPHAVKATADTCLLVTVLFPPG